MKALAILGILAILGGASVETKLEPVKQIQDYVLIIEEKTDMTSSEVPMMLQTEQGIQSISLEDYLVGVVLTEMPPSFHMEALKAQSVAARTFARRMMLGKKHNGFDLCNDPGCCQAWRGEVELREAFGAEYAENMKKATAAVEQTAGEVLTYNDELIEAVYFSCSGGMSEPAVAVWGTEIPYLQAVESPGEENASKFCTEISISFQEFCQTLQNYSKEVSFSVIPQDWIGNVSYSDGGGVDSMCLGGVSFSGTELRRLFSLPSTKFEIAVRNGEVLFTVYGYGHRVGMSQYGAEAMAAADADYKDILTHYYTDVVIKKLSRM